MQKNIIPMLALLMPVTLPLAAFAQSTATIASDESAKPPLMVTVRQIELKLFGEESHQALPDRINALEQSALGTTFHGPLTERVDRVEATLQGRTSKVPSAAGIAAAARFTRNAPTVGTTGGTAGPFDEHQILNTLAPAPLKAPDESVPPPVLHGSVTDATLQASPAMQGSVIDANSFRTAPRLQAEATQTDAANKAAKKQARAERNARIRREIGTAIGTTLKAAAVVAAVALVTVASSSATVGSSSAPFHGVDTCACQTYTSRYTSTMMIASHHHHHH